MLASPLPPDLWRVIAAECDLPTTLALSRSHVGIFVVLGSFVQMMDKCLLVGAKHMLNKIERASHFFHAFRWEQLTGREGATFVQDVMREHFQRLPLARYLRGLHDEHTLSDDTVIVGDYVRAHCLEAFRKAGVRVESVPLKYHTDEVDVWVSRAVDPKRIIPYVERFKGEFFTHATESSVYEIASKVPRDVPTMRFLLTGELERRKFLSLYGMPFCGQSRVPWWIDDLLMLGQSVAQIALTDCWWRDEHNGAEMWMTPLAAYALVTGKAFVLAAASTPLRVLEVMKDVNGAVQVLLRPPPVLQRVKASTGESWTWKTMLSASGY